MATLSKRYLYKISRNGTFIGVLQNVTSKFDYSQNINSAGTALTVTIGSNPDNAREEVDTLITESEEDLLTEAGDTLTTERFVDIVGNSNSQSLIRNNNDLEVYEFSDNYPNGLLVFSGFISKWKATFGKSRNMSITCLSYGAELDNYLILGADTLDNSQATSNQTFTSHYWTDPVFPTVWMLTGQTFVPSAGVTNLASILVYLCKESAAQADIEVTLKVWASSDDYYSGGTPLGSVTKIITADFLTLTEYTFTFATPITVVPGTTYFFSLTPAATSYYGGVSVAYKDTNVYADGQMLTSIYSGGGGGGWEGGYGPDVDLYFKTYYTAGATSSPYSSVDPVTMLRSIIDSYSNRGGVVDYDGTSTTLTGLTDSYTFKVNTILEGIKKILNISPSDFYWYVDPATSIINFKQTSTTAEHTMILGRHIESLDIEASIEDTKNSVFFTGGDTGGGSNLYLNQSDTTSIDENNGRVGLARLTDNRVTQTTTGDAIIDNFLEANARENYITTIVINDETYDTNLFELGQVIGFAGFGNFVDDLLLQIVQVKKEDTRVTLGLGVLFRRATARVEEIERRLAEVETVDNPTAPS